MAMESALLGMFMSPLVKLILDKLETWITKRAWRPGKVRKKLKFFRDEMSKIHTVLLAAEKSGRVAAKFWEQELSEVLYDMEDLLDAIETEDNREASANQINYIECEDSQRGMENQRSVWKKVSDWNPLKGPDIFLRYSGEIADIEKALARIKEDTKDYNSMVELVAGKNDNELCEKWTQPTYSLLGAEREIFIGREDEKKEIIEFLLSENKDENSLSIVGIGGLGKTALAKMVCNCDKIKKKFEVKWAHVSFREFNLGKIICEILGRTKTESTLHDLLNSLQDKLADETCLFVLDDLWDMSPVQWNEIKNLLLNIRKGNKVLITTRYQPIADLAAKIICLKPLLPRLCLPLIEKYAQPANPSPVRYEVVQNCAGVPLAAITLGVMLSKTNLQDDDVVWSLTEPKAEDSNIMKSLKLSYDNLKYCVKRCFEYHAICNDGIDKERLVQMWSAQGFIQQTDEQEGFKELQYASFFSDVEEDIFNQRTRFKALKLFRDLAFLVSTDYSYIRKPYNKPQLPSTTRHIHVLQPAQNQTQLVDDSKLRELKKLRTFARPHEIKMLSDFKRLRVLDLCLSEFDRVPDSIGDMKHLRYLDLSQNQLLEGLPTSIGKLFNLKTLRLDKCGSLRELPDDVGDLIQLKHLYVTSRQASLELGSFSSLQTLHLENLVGLVKLPNMSQCIALETLGIFDCSHLCIGENDLKDLKNLRRLALVNLPELVNFPKLATVSAGLQTLVIFYCPGLCLGENDLKDLPNLRRLALVNLPKLVDLPKLVTFSEGSGHSNHKLTSLCLSNCPRLTKLPEWFRSLTSLERLTIDCCHELTLRCKGEDRFKINHVEEIYLDGVRIQSQHISDVESSILPSAVSDCHEPTQKPEKGGEIQLKLNLLGDEYPEVDDVLHISIRQSSNIASSSSDRSKLKGKGKLGMSSRK